jgi:predicted nuclease with RNAse H fold
MSARQVGFSIGWDVGGWNCDKNPQSRDALAILDAAGHDIGGPWRGNLRACINNCQTAADFRAALLKLCKTDPSDAPITLAIDAPLALPSALIHLASSRWVETVGDSGTNPYLFRFTERRLFRPGLSPLSAVKDMIGSQTTKAMHAVAKFAPIREATGVWTDGVSLRIIETYPAACRSRAAFASAISPNASAREIDIADARICALIAHRYVSARHILEGPTPDAPPSEGWIWLPLASGAGNI